MSISFEEYAASPTRASSLPFWKNETFVTPKNMLVLSEDEYKRVMSKLAAFDDEPYFKLVFRVNENSTCGLSKLPVPKGYLLEKADALALSEHIRLCYGGGPDESEIESYKRHSTFDERLWILLRNEKTGRIAASGVAEIDSRIGEGILEWIQVSPDERRKGLGSFIVFALMSKMLETVNFITVSGSLKNESNPLALYKNCGFGEMAVWHVLTKKLANKL